MQILTPNHAKGKIAVSWMQMEILFLSDTLPSTTKSQGLGGREISQPRDQGFTLEKPKSNITAWGLPGASESIPVGHNHRKFGREQ